MNTKGRDLLNLSSHDNYQEILIKSAGTDIALSVYSTGKENTSVVFLPGTMTHPLFYDEFLSIIANNGFNVVGVHFVSHGKSPRQKRKYTFEDLLQNAQDAVTFCTEYFGQNIIVMGSSQGGILSMALAAKDHRIKAVFAHNILLPSLRESISVTKFASFFKPFYNTIPPLMNFGAYIFPSIQIPITAYLKFDRITRSKSIKDRFYHDPLGLTAYPLQFLASLFSADMSGMTSGGINCPVVVIASTGDPLFKYDYCTQVFNLIVAPKKELMVFDLQFHLIFNECIDDVTLPIVNKLKEYSE
ncbi:MAG: alpha/beta hydrolase [Dehalogenimonas sp.]